VDVIIAGFGKDQGSGVDIGCSRTVVGSPPESQRAGAAHIHFNPGQVPEERGRRGLSGSHHACSRGALDDRAACPGDAGDVWSEVGRIEITTAENQVVVDGSAPTALAVIWPALMFVEPP
jgi:hypothetical protein